MHIPKKFYDMPAVATYTVILFSVASFLIGFAYEGWEDKGVKPMLTPLGIWGGVIFLLAIGLGVWNFTRNKPRHSQWEKIMEIRRPELKLLKDELRDYFSYTFRLSKSSELYNLSVYDFGTQPKLLDFIKLVDNNQYYLSLKADYASEKLDSVEAIVDQLSEKRLRKLLQSTLRSEHKARSQQIAIRLYRIQYPHTKWSSKKLLESESHQKIPNHIKAFKGYRNKLHGYICWLYRGDDYD